MNCMYNMERVQNIGHGDYSCQFCLGILKTTNHILFLFPKAQRGWASVAIFYEETPQDSTLVDARSIIDVIDSCLVKSPHGTAQIFIVYHTC